MQELTARQRAVYEFIADYLAGRGYPPTLQDIAAHLRITGNLGVIRHLTALEKKGYIARQGGSSRGIRLLTPPAGGRLPGRRFLPVVGTVRAGSPELPVEDIEEYHSLDERIADSGGEFFLRVKGDSMINAAISEGDLALIRPQADARHRDIVVALVDGEATLKRFYREPGRIRLQPENPNMEPIIVRDGEREVTIIGKVVGIYRHFG